jgi:hypothetical protein
MDLDGTKEQRKP